MILARRSFLTGLGAALVTAPAIVRVGSIMPVKVMESGPFPLDLLTDSQMSIAKFYFARERSYERQLREEMIAKYLFYETAQFRSLPAHPAFSPDAPPSS